MDGSLRTLVDTYAAAKSRQDVAGALAVCRDDFVLDTPAFGTRAHGRAEAAAQLQAFFAAFPDYGVALEGHVADGGTVACWGTATMTLAGPLLDVPPTGRTARIPFASVFAGSSGCLASERFYFDLANLCAQLGLSTDRVAASLGALRAARDGFEARA